MHAVVLRTSRIHILGLIWMCCAAHLASVQAVGCPSSYNCATCDDSVPGQEQCTSCPSYYFLTTTSPRQCQPCGNRCRVCQSGQPCQTCDTSYGPSTSTNSSDCGACVPGPALCAGGCTRNGAGKCDQCTDGYRLESNQSSCTPCPPHCKSCQTSSSACDVCSPGYFPYTNRTCGPCAANCSTYQCQQSGAGKCDKCDSGYGLTAANTCAPCSPGCNLTIGCNTAGTCIQCNNGYGLLSNQSCGPCSANCAAGCKATGAYKCDQCDAGTAPSPNGTCSRTTTTATTAAAGTSVSSTPMPSRSSSMNAPTSPATPTYKTIGWTSLGTGTERLFYTTGPNTPFGSEGGTTTSESAVGPGGNNMCLVIGLAIGVPCGVIIIILLIVLIVYLHRNRRLQNELKEARSQNAAAANPVNREQLPDSCHVITHPRVVSRYQSLTERAPEPGRYDRITHYEPIGSDTTQSVSYERPIFP